MDQRYQAALQQAYEQGRQQGQQEGGSVSLDMGLAKIAAELRGEFNAQLNRQAGHFRREMAGKDAHIDQKLSELAAIANAVNVTQTGGGGMGGGSQRDEGNIIRPGTIRIEDIPGRRIPYVYAVKIAIGNNTTSTREATVTISQEGPFVAVKRMAIFQSAYQFQITDPDNGQVSRFGGRSHGRYRPAHSAWDLLDAQHNAIADSATWFLSAMANPGMPVGSELPAATLGVPSTLSSFRTMEFDGEISVEAAASSFPRQNIPIPSAFWSTSINAPWDLGALDFFERSDAITVAVQPLHVNNPPVGNVDGGCVFPVTQNGGTGWPFLDGQYDAHEGICTPGAVTLGDDNPLLVNLLATDSVQRLPDGILILAWEGYRIVQPIGPAP